MNCGLAVFAKFPEPGHVKTRLAKSVGNDEAARIYERLLGHFHEHTLAHLPGEFSVTWYCDPRKPIGAYRELFAFTGFPAEPQKGADLGERMRNCLSTLLHRCSRAIVVGTDCPDLTPAILAQASSALIKSDLVVGPAGDGGYYLLGLRRAAPELFEGIPWSTPEVLKLTLERAEQLGWKTEILQPLSDIDDKKDWDAIGWRVDEENESTKKLRRRKT